MLDIFNKIVGVLTWRAAQIAQIALFLAMMIIAGNVILREFWKPLPGTVELAEMCGAVLLGMGVAYTAMMKGHIAVSVLVDRLKPRIRGIVELVVSIIAFLFSFVLAREIFLYALYMMERGYSTGHLGLPMAPSIFFVAFGFIMLSLVLVRDLIKAVITVVKGSESE